jgi:DNA repair exonuclease SbcCD ATPase subunit
MGLPAGLVDRAERTDMSQEPTPELLAAEARAHAAERKLTQLRRGWTDGDCPVCGRRKGQHESAQYAACLEALQQAYLHALKELKEMTR